MTKSNMKVVAYEYELATRILGGVTGDKGYASFEKRLSKIAPNVPEGAMRSLNPLVTLASAQAEIATLKQANESLMRERANITETHREQLERLTKERDEWRDHVLKQNGNVAHNHARAEAAEKERDTLREALTPFANIGISSDPMSRITVTIDREFILTARSALIPLESKND